MREAAAQHRDDHVRLVDRERRLCDVCKRPALRERDALRVLHRLDEDDRLRRLAERPLDLLVTLVPDEDDGVAGFGVAARLRMHLGDEWAGRVDCRQRAVLRLAAHGRGDAVGGEHDGRPFGHVPQRIDEDGATPAEIVDDVRVVHDLLSDVDRSPVERERALDRLDRPFDSRAIASRGGEEKAFHHCPATLAGKYQDGVGGTARDDLSRLQRWAGRPIVRLANAF